MAATQEKQLKMWCDFIISYVEAKKKVEINVAEDSKSDLFTNSKLKRVSCL